MASRCPFHTGIGPGNEVKPVPPPVAAAGPWLSVLVPAYNYGRFIARAIESVLGQRAEGVEVVVIDDESADETRSVVARYGAVRYLRQTHGGPYAACKLGLNATTSRHVLFLDADDCLADGALRHVEEAVRLHPEAAIIFGGVVNVSADGSRRLSPPPAVRGEPVADFREFVRGGLAISAGGAVVRRDVFDAFMGREDPMPHGMDRVIVGRALALGPCHRIDRPVVEVYEHDGRLRDDASSIAASGAAAARWLFAPGSLPPWATCCRGVFTARLLREHARVFANARWDRKVIGAYAAAVRADPRSLLDTRGLRRAIVSAVRCAVLADATPRPARPPSPGAHPIFGHRPQLLRDPIPFVLDCVKRHGHTVRLRAGRRTYLLSDPLDIKHVLAVNALNYRKSGFEVAFRGFFGEGLTLLEDARHRRDRKTLAPYLRPTRLVDRVPYTASTIAAHASRWPDGATINLAADMMLWAARLQSRFAFGIDDPARVEALFACLHAAHHGMVRRWRRLVPIPAWAPVRANLRGGRALRTLRGIVLNRIGELRRTPHDDGSILGTLLLARQAGGPPLTDRQIADIAAGMFIPADPVANTFAWACLLLNQNPGCEAQLLEELSRVLQGRLPEPTDLAGLPYTHMVVDETLRLYPTVWMIARRAVDLDRLPGGLTVPAGSRIWISPMAVHRSARHFEDPERFIPERFDASRAAKPDPYAYIPFGGGPRICIGNHLARITLVTALATVLPRCRFEPLADHPATVESTNGFIMQPTNGRLMMRVTRRGGPS